MTPPTDRSPIVASLRRPTPTPSALELRRGDGPALLLPREASDMLRDLLRSDAAVSLTIVEAAVGSRADAEAYQRSADWAMALADWLDRMPGGAGDRVEQTWLRIPTGSWFAEAAIAIAAAPVVGEGVA